MRSILFFLALFGLAGAEERRLTLRAAVEQGLGSNAALRAADARVQSAYWSYQKSASLQSTQVTAGTIAGSNVPGSVTGGNNPSGAGAGFATFAANGRTDTYVQVTQPFLPLGSGESARRVAWEEYRQVAAGYQAAQAVLRQQIKDAFFNLVAAQDLLGVAEGNLRVAEEVYQLAESRFSAGAGPQLDLIDAGVQRSRAHQEVVRSQSSLRQLQAALAPLLNLPASDLLVGEGALEVPRLELDFPQLLARAEENPQVSSALSALERNRASRSLAAQQAHPTPLLTAIHDWTTQTYQLQVGLQFPLDWGQIRNEVRAREQQVVEQEATLESTRLSVASQLKSAFELYQGAARNASEFREKVLLPSEQSARITQYGFRSGAVPYLRLLSSQQNLAAVRKEYIALLQSAQLAWNAVEAATGRPLVFDT
ncbi:hypothetical protein ABS71_04690 [bacterium SCN 62-11]|nr:TolC family protein [Candidatus Eremiobacteraeota bacterium]ODT75246.1 MAG: hypothetical protein ABS71_04690 [bacterium SCN 62-11]